MRVFDRTSQRAEEDAALLQPKPRWSWNPFHYLWTAMQHVAWFLSSPDLCCYCLAWRMFFIGLVMGIELMYFFPWIKVW